MSFFNSSMNIVGEVTTRKVLSLPLRRHQRVISDISEFKVILVECVERKLGDRYWCSELRPSVKMCGTSHLATASHTSTPNSYHCPTPLVPMPWQTIVTAEVHNANVCPSEVAERGANASGRLKIGSCERINTTAKLTTAAEQKEKGTCMGAPPHSSHHNHSLPFLHGFFPATERVIFGQCQPRAQPSQCHP